MGQGVFTSLPLLVAEELGVSKKEVYTESLRVKRKIKAQTREEDLPPGKNCPKPSGEQGT